MEEPFVNNPDGHFPMLLDEDELKWYHKHTGDNRVYENYELSKNWHKMRDKILDPHFYDIITFYDGMEKQAKLAFDTLQNDPNWEQYPDWADNLKKFAKIMGMSANIKYNMKRGEMHILHSNSLRRVKNYKIDPNIYTKEFLADIMEEENVFDFPTFPDVDEEETGKEETEHVPPPTSLSGHEALKHQIRQQEFYKILYKACEKSGLSEEASDKIAGTMFLTTGYAMLGGVAFVAIGVLSSLVAIPVFTAKAIKKAQMQKEQELKQYPRRKKSIEKKYEKILNHK